MFPRHRPRRLRRTESIRRLVRETVLTVDDLVFPMFVVPGTGVRREIASMPGNYHLSVDEFLREVERVAQLSIPGILLFGIPEHKDECGSEAWSETAPVQCAVRAVKRTFPELCVMTDVCLCEYTSHGHCGVIEDGRVANDPTLELVAKAALSHAEAGADIVAPSDMMDGRVLLIREALDEAGFSEVAILSYAAKYASAFYGPFREAAGSAPQFGDRRGYQMDPPNMREAVREVAADIEEGADIVMVKPALPYLDVLGRLAAMFSIPLAAYHVSGEFAMLKAAARNGWLEERRAALETLTSIKRAGADFVLTYYAPDAAGWLREICS